MSINRGMYKEDVLYAYNGILLSHKKRIKIPFAATCINPEIAVLSEVSQTERDKCMMSLICGI